jgi:DNA repair protein SbcD/Mre11
LAVVDLKILRDLRSCVTGGKVGPDEPSSLLCLLDRAWRFQRPFSMRILHTSDWHLGRSFGPYSLAADQERFCEWLVKVARDQAADLVVVAGDIYDRAIAPRESIELFRETVRMLLDAGPRVAIISGNHDGADRLAPYDKLLDLSGAYVRGGYQGVGQVLTLEFEDGPLDVIPLPFLDPQAAPDDFGAPAEAEETASERRRLRDHQSVLVDALTLARKNRRAPRSLAIAHAFVEGGQESESERLLTVGGTGAVSATIFEGIDYVALGHLHRPQEVGRPEVRYSGTPLPYSFSEAHEKSVTVVDMRADGRCTLETVPVDGGRRVVTLEGEMAQLLDPAFASAASDCFVRAMVTDRQTVLDAKAKLAKLYPWVVEVRLERRGAPEGATTAPVDVRSRQPLEVVERFWQEVEGAPPDPEQKRVLVESLEAAGREEV